MLLKIKQERMLPDETEPPPEGTEGETPLPKKKVFAISSDVEEIEDDDDEQQEEVHGEEEAHGGEEALDGEDAHDEEELQHEEQEHQYHSEQDSLQEGPSVPTISNVVSIKQEAMAARKEYNEY